MLKDPEVLTDLIKSLKSKDSLARSAAAENLGRLGPQAKFAIAGLAERLLDTDPKVRSKAALALGQIGSAAVPELIIALRNPDKYVRREAVWALAKIGPEAGSAVFALAKVLRDTDAPVRKGAARALGQVGREAQAAIPLLIEALKNSDLLFCRLVAWALGKIGASAVPALMRALNHPDKYVRREAVWALGHIGPESRSAIGILITILKNPPLYLPPTLGGDREGGPLSVTRKAGPNQETELVFLTSIRDARLRAYAAHALGQIGPEAHSAVPALTAVLADANDKVAAAAARALDQILGPNHFHLARKSA
jgi:HEAT repeat protein